MAKSKQRAEKFTKYRNAITDVAGVAVGHTTLISGDGKLERGKGPVILTNTHSVGVVRDAVIEWRLKHRLYDPLPGEPDVFWALPVVAETYDGDLNDINGFHVTREHAFAALDSAWTGPVAEGNVGGGTGIRAGSPASSSTARHGTCRPRRNSGGVPSAWR